MPYKPTIGLEIHSELKTNSKMFCSCKNDPNEHCPNINICPTCTAQPGTLPVINEEAVRKVIKTGLAVDCEIPNYSKFDRKNYFYPDLPKSYQITQKDNPICKNGYLFIDTEKNLYKKIPIERIHIEEDAGKILFSQGNVNNKSLIDLNRSGAPLIEIVTLAVISSPEEAVDFLKTLKTILLYLDVSDCNMEEGSLRCDCNVSIKKKDTNALGTRCEIKNLNSFRFIKNALDYEINRQKNILNKNESIHFETRLYDGKKNITLPMRDKEENSDYRYFPEPDLLPISISEKDIDRIKKSIPILPYLRFRNYLEKYNISQLDAKSISNHKHLSDFYEETIAITGNRIKII